MSDDSNSSGRATVRTYIPEHQEGIWKEEAEAMDMSLSEFVRSMVQAGRRDFDFGENDDDAVSVKKSGENRGVDYVLDALRDEPYLSFDQLAERGEEELANRLDALMEEDVIRYRPRRDGFVIVEED